MLNIFKTTEEKLEISLKKNNVKKSKALLKKIDYKNFNEKQIKLYLSLCLEHKNDDTRELLEYIFTLNKRNESFFRGFCFDFISADIDNIFKKHSDFLNYYLNQNMIVQAVGFGDTHIRILLLHNSIVLNNFDVFKYICSTYYDIDIIECFKIAEIYNKPFIKTLFKDKEINKIFSEENPEEYLVFLKKYGREEQIKRNIDNF